VQVSQRIRDFVVMPVDLAYPVHRRLQCLTCLTGDISVAGS
jgi:hypothetical protein